MSNAGTERAEHIQILINSTQKVYNLIPTLDGTYDPYGSEWLKATGNIRISLPLIISYEVWA